MSVMILSHVLVLDEGGFKMGSRSSASALAFEKGFNEECRDCPCRVHRKARVVQRRLHRHLAVPPVGVGKPIAQRADPVH
jgi:hypothetical protein